jgi:hypothetical protein
MDSTLTGCCRGTRRAGATAGFGPNSARAASKIFLVAKPTKALVYLLVEKSPTYKYNNNINGM